MKQYAAHGRFTRGVLLLAALVVCAWPGGPPTDSIWRYDNGQYGTGRVLYESRYRAVSFNTGPAILTSLHTLTSGENGLNHAGYFAVHADSANAPGPVIWTSEMVYIDSLPHWRVMACSIPVSGRFHVAFFPYEGSAGNVAQYWDNNGDQAPANSQWRYNSGRWYPDANAGDLMIRCFASIHDVGLAHWLAPSGAIDSGAYIVPACTLHNPGDHTESFMVHLRIGDFYRDSVSIWFLESRNSLRTSFQGFLGRVPTGSYVITCSTYLAGDRNPLNNVYWETLRVVPNTGVNEPNRTNPAPVQFSLHPNPFHDRVEIRAAPAAGSGLQVCDATGRIVRTFGVASAVTLWDGRDAFGRRVPPGVYLIRLPGSTTARLVRR